MPVVRISTPEEIDEWDFVQKIMASAPLVEDGVSININPADLRRLIHWAVRDWNRRNPGEDDGKPGVRYEVRRS